MKIIRVKTHTFDELLTKVWNEELKTGLYKNNYGQEVVIRDSYFKLLNNEPINRVGNWIILDDPVELTDGTEFNNLWITYEEDGIVKKSRLGNPHKYLGAWIRKDNVLKVEAIDERVDNFVILWTKENGFNSTNETYYVWDGVIPE